MNYITLNSTFKHLFRIIDRIKFLNDASGIHIIGNHFSPYIYHCDFYDNAVGVNLDTGASPEFRNCTFDNCEIGIKTEMSSASDRKSVV